MFHLVTNDCFTLYFFIFFFFKQKTAYEMRISDWSSECALPIYHQPHHQRGQGEGLAGAGGRFDRVHAFEREVEVGIARAHSASSTSSAAAMSRSAARSVPAYVMPATTAE